jgi:uncharacterized glyoxalase superfamily protein PhnB
MTQPVPKGFQTLTPYLVLPNLKDFLPFIEKAFDATVTERIEGPGGAVMHAEARIGTSMLMMGEAMDGQEPRSGMLYLYVDDCEAWFQRAVDGGAQVLRPLEDQFYGDRMGGVTDAFGNIWWIGSRIEDLTEEELQKRAQEAHG